MNAPTSGVCESVLCWGPVVLGISAEWECGDLGFLCILSFSLMLSDFSTMSVIVFLMGEGVSIDRKKITRKEVTLDSIPQHFIFK